jgi:beta-N-acetylglucosaminidase
MAERQVELEKTLQNRTTAPVRGGRTGSLMDMPVTQPSGLNAFVFERAFIGTGLVGIGGALVKAEAATGVSALVLAGIVVLETGWGSSRLASEKNNMGGIGAYDGREYSSGIMFDSREVSIMFLAELLAMDYAPGGRFYGGSYDLAGIGVRYASDPAWAAKVGECMRVIAGRATS